MEELKDEASDDEQNINEDNFSYPPILSPVAAADSVKAATSYEKDQQMDTPPPAELTVSSVAISKKSSYSKTTSDELKKKYSKTGKEVQEYQFKLRQYHMVKGQKLYKCDICAGTYRYAFSLKRHFLRNHINYKYLSDADLSNCNINISLVNSNRERLKFCTENVSQSSSNSIEHSIPQESSSVSAESSQITLPYLYSCYLCSEYFHLKSDLKSHVENHSVVIKQKEFKCEKCEIPFTLKKNLIRHLAMHTTEKTFVCKYCSKQFLSLSSQKKHERIHEGKKLSRCSYCTSTFSSNNSLTEHIQNQHKDYFHPCTVCSKFFDTKQSLAEHSEQHVELPSSNNLPKRKSPLSNGIDHTNFIYEDEALELIDAPDKFDYTCTVCKKKFTSYVNMCRHRRLAHHTSTKKRGRPQKSKINKIENDVKVISNGISEMTESEFYLNIAQKISDNLVNYVDGKYFNIEQYHDQNNSFDVIPDNDIDVAWDLYNFPPNFDYQQLELESELQNVNGIEISIQHSPDNYETNMPSPIDFPNGSFDTDSEKYSDVDEKESDCFLSEDEYKIENRQLIGQTIPLIYICCACLERFHSLVAIEEHKLNNHPNVYCTHIEIEGEKNVPPEFCKQYCSPVGILRQCVVPSLNAQENNGFNCTKCKSLFNSVSDLHLHILECGGDSNFKRSFKVDNGQKKDMRKKRLRHVKLQTYSPQKKKNVDKTLKEKSPKSDDTDQQYYFSEPEIKENKIAHETYTCVDCTKVFNHSSTFERHRRGCRQKLSLDRSSHGKLHVKSSKTTGQHFCPHCKRAFTYLTSLKKHIKDICSKKKLKPKSVHELTSTKDNSNYVDLSSNDTECSTCQLNNSNAETAGKGKEIKFNKNTEAHDTTNSNISKVNINELTESQNCTNILNKKLKIILADRSIESKAAECIKSSTDEGVKAELLLGNEELLPLKQSENNENLSDELLIKGKVLDNQELQPLPQQRSCPHCLRSFAYLANFRRHIKEVCPVKKQLVKDNEEGIKTRLSVPMYSVTTFSVKGKIEDSVIGLLRDQSRQSELMKGSEPEINSPAPSSRFRTFSCKICHKIFLSFVKMLQHRLSHKLQSDESEDLPKIDLGLMQKLQDDSTEYEQQNAQEILNNLDSYLCKTENADSSKETNQSTLHVLEEESIKNLENSEKSNSDLKNEEETDNDMSSELSCEICSKTFTNALSKHRHYRLAHKKNKTNAISLVDKKSSKRKSKKSIVLDLEKLNVTNKIIKSNQEENSPVQESTESSSSPSEIQDENNIQAHNYALPSLTNEQILVHTNDDATERNEVFGQTNDIHVEKSLSPINQKGQTPNPKKKRRLKKKIYNLEQEKWHKQQHHLEEEFLIKKNRTHGRRT